MLCHFFSSLPFPLSNFDCFDTPFDSHSPSIHKHIEPNIFHISVRTHSLLRIQTLYTHPIHILLLLRFRLCNDSFLQLMSMRVQTGKCFPMDYWRRIFVVLEISDAFKESEMDWGLKLIWLISMANAISGCCWQLFTESWRNRKRGKINCNAFEAVLEINMHLISKYFDAEARWFPIFLTFYNIFFPFTILVMTIKMNWSNR